MADYGWVYEAGCLVVLVSLYLKIPLGGSVKGFRVW